ncbi:hypothetical protein BZA05DRAFT_404241 [Tricharina praecox]|uniref:uncharacterized protein n=1 Tax=Tricharina praecox TaxID=43433 RepID=UPI00221F3324|nr:uncharacterized protein BZA05DRAFT_404241 [Tricharina praecox]KAI5848042.1 hypothetical protein BZA05DRAFT_404241 [Tricharina praecox]
MFSTSPFPLPVALLIVLVLLALSLPSSAASSSLLFCKCTCFTNSTIIPLPATGNCNDCNRQFCIDYNLPICKTAKEADVVTTCFQRDSLKDQVVVCVFIFATVGLLAWAVIRPCANRWVEQARRGMRGYQGVPAAER